MKHCGMNCGCLECAKNHSKCKRNKSNVIVATATCAMLYSIQRWLQMLQKVVTVLIWLSDIMDRTVALKTHSM